MQVADWPAGDRASWLSALAPANPFEPAGGERAEHAAVSNARVQKGYGRCLTWLSITSRPTLDQPPHQRITVDRVKAYVSHLRHIGNGSQTILSRLQDLGQFARLLEPCADWTFINRLASRVRSSAAPVRDKRAKLVMTDELSELGQALIVEARAQTTARRAAIMFRDGLTIALLAMQPLRRKNLAGLRLDHTLVRCGEGWSIRISGLDTKSRTPIEAPWPDCLAGPLEQYLAVHRPFLIAGRGRWTAPTNQALWVSSDGSAMTQMALYDRIRQRTQERLGKAVNPHLFRDAAATTMAIHDPDHVRLASPILGHRSFATTERHYQQAQTIAAHRRFTAHLDHLRGNPSSGSIKASAEEQDP